MQEPLRKNRKRRRHWRWVVLAGAGAVLIAALVLYLNPGGIVGGTPQATEEPEDVYSYGELSAHEAAQVARLTITNSAGETWSIVRNEDGTYTVDGEDGFTVSDDMAEQLTEAASVVSYDEILTDDPSEYAGDLSEFGLDQPRVIMTAEYTDGTSVTCRIGSAALLEDETWSYMLVDGDDRLFAVDKGTVDDLNVDRALLHEVVQPTIHKARIDRITCTGQDESVFAGWELQGEITDSDASNEWMVTSPWRYPADGESMDGLLSNAANLRLGAWVCGATEENLEEYGFSDPRLVLELHMAAGTVSVTGEDGTTGAEDFPESTLTLTVGGAKNDNVDYVRYGDDIYISSHYSVGLFMNLDPMDYVSRYPVMVGQDQVASFTVTTASGTDTYELTTEVETDENGDPVTGEDGELSEIKVCTRNGRSFSADSFLAGYARLEVVSVSGVLPDGWTQTEECHTLYTIVTTSGQTHTIGLTPFDALHDAVVVDGCALFYLIQDGMVFSADD